MADEENTQSEPEGTEPAEQAAEPKPAAEAAPAAPQAEQPAPEPAAAAEPPTPAAEEDEEEQAPREKPAVPEHTLRSTSFPRARTRSGAPRSTRTPTPSRRSPIRPRRR